MKGTKWKGEGQPPEELSSQKCWSTATRVSVMWLTSCLTSEIAVSVGRNRNVKYTSGLWKPHQHSPNQPGKQARPPDRHMETVNLYWSWSLMPGSMFPLIHFMFFTISNIWISFYVQCQNFNLVTTWSHWCRNNRQTGSWLILEGKFRCNRKLLKFSHFR